MNNIAKIHQQYWNILEEAWNDKHISDGWFLKISTMLGELHGWSLQYHPDNVSRETYSPDYRNRPTSESSTIVEDMNNKENNMNIEQALQVLVTHITEQVTEAMQAVIETAVEEALENYDPTEHYNFTDSVKDALSGVSITISGEID